MTDDEDDAPALPVAKSRRLPVGRKAVVTKLWRAAKRQLDAHEARLDELPTGAAASEADAMALEGTTPVQENKATDDADPADGLRYAAELRKELARRLDALADREMGQDHPEISPSGAGPSA